jgi:hypothetical protein
MSDLYIYWGVYNSNFLVDTIYTEPCQLNMSGVKTQPECLLSVMLSVCYLNKASTYGKWLYLCVF